LSLITFASPSHRSLNESMSASSRAARYLTHWLTTGPSRTADGRVRGTGEIDALFVQPEL
jgi:hypothetical protein